MKTYQEMDKFCQIVGQSCVLTCQIQTDLEAPVL